jgi:hypothetical protein
VIRQARGERAADRTDTHLHLVAKEERAVAIQMRIPLHASDYPNRVGIFASDAVLSHL